MFTFLTVYISYRTFYDVLLSKREKKKMLEIKNKIKIKMYTAVQSTEDCHTFKFSKPIYQLLKADLQYWHPYGTTDCHLQPFGAAI